mmetsp:Transcript_4774/g.7455  ORF Transcript_4774/g.7455 Transcript_4774/m.7455 type:complete len:109 (+) Transcript_4774:382-708(+)
MFYVPVQANERPPNVHCSSSRRLRENKRERPCHWTTMTTTKHDNDIEGRPATSLRVACRCRCGRTFVKRRTDYIENFQDTRYIIILIHPFVLPYQLDHINHETSSLHL